MPYACPNCRNRSRFYMIEQNPVPVKLDPQTGDIIEQVSQSDPLLIPFRGEMLRMQCGVCGIAENASVFAKRGQQPSVQNQTQLGQQQLMSNSMHTGQNSLLPFVSNPENRGNHYKQFRM